MDYNISFEDITDRMLSRIDDDFDKRETSLVYQSIAMNVPEYIEIASELEFIEDEAYPDTCNYKNLVRKCRERDITPIPATYGTVRAELSLKVEINARFITGGRVYKVLELLKEPNAEIPEEEKIWIYSLIAEETGHIEFIGDLIPIDEIQGLKHAKITEIIEDGRDEEDIDSLRARYNYSLVAQSFGGNKTEYKQRISEMDNIGGVKVFRRKEGKNNIEIYIADTNFKGASEEVVRAVQDAIDPTQDGEGLGLAPIDHIVKINAAIPLKVNINATIKVRDNADITKDVKMEIEEYFKDLRYEWSNTEDGLIIRLVKIESLIFGIHNVIDIENITINGQTKNIMVEATNIPVLGEVVIN
ncbi:Uncharacterized phage protein gp47/JayE [Peptostreptococcus russellii]|uniref:Uncharacterized phage protein gp47/JayE n=1 Tax=Peptostreptococcus russellii TaxID=215200 RepID=A0A1H8JI22_9FIRM|nr:baseplate J/gp47 family protein [Peptostreptococcus russellii]SEN79956.1 Uncharacterized phage protein gp47/JayE [Peptostreptococcus russellii]